MLTIIGQAVYSSVLYIAPRYRDMEPIVLDHGEVRQSAEGATAEVVEVQAEGEVAAPTWTDYD